MQLLPHHSPGTVQTQQNVVIDFSSFKQAEANSGDFSMLIEWVRSYPCQSDVHVYLPSNRTLTNARQLQSTLLSLGCTVTKRLPLCHN